MRLTTKGRFAVTAMIDLAMFAQHGPVTLAMISQRQNISLSYLEQLFGKLRRQHLVQSIRGAKGGYTLRRLACHITVADIVLAVDEPLDATHCGGKQNCAKDAAGQARKCMTHELWITLNHKMIAYLGSVSLQDLVDQQQEGSVLPAHLKSQTKTVPLQCRVNGQIHGTSIDSEPCYPPSSKPTGASVGV